MAPGSVCRSHARLSKTIAEEFGQRIDPKVAHCFDLHCHYQKLRKHRMLVEQTSALQGINSNEPNDEAGDDQCYQEDERELIQLCRPAVGSGPVCQNNVTLYRVMSRWGGH
jgi:hypothetical protein